MNKKYNLFTFFTLYIAQSIPMSFFATALPVLMRQGDYSLWAIAMLKLIKLPWIIKFLWSPWVDSRSESVRDYKRWIIGSEIIYAGIILFVAFLRIETDFSLIITLVILAFIASATQDIATDAMAARAFPRNDSSLLNSMQSMGSFTGSMVGGGFLLLIFHQVGWGKLLPWVGIFVLVALIPLWFNKKITLRERKVKEKAKPKDMYLFFRQKNIGWHIAFLLLFYAGLIGILSTLRPYMVDLGYDMKEIGAMVGVFGTATGICCSFLSGVFIRKIGKNSSRKIISTLIVGVAAYFLWFSTSETITHTMMLTGIGLLWGTYGMATTMVYTTSMDIVRDGREGTDFTMQIVITHLSSMLVAIGCSRFGDVHGFRGMFVLELGIALVAFAYVMFYKPQAQ
ncbi:MAG: MFS transporter [Bacteroidia bacterium]|nr:MFS transporter [Bacteroidia bacterium]